MTTISVIIPTLNMGRFLPDALASIERQRVPVDEIIIVDSASNDGTADLVANLCRQDQRIQVVQTPPEGPAGARNQGLRVATGDLIAFLDADDLWVRDKLALQVARLDRGPQVDFVSGFITYFNVLDTERLEPAPASRVETMFLIHVAACVCRRSVFDQVGLFDESQLYAEDMDFYLRVMEAGIPLAIMTTPVLYYRRHGDSMMARDHPRKKLDMARAFATSLARRRQSGALTELPPFETYYEASPEIGR